MKEVLPSLGFVVTADIYNSDTTDCSDIILPAAHWLERGDARLAANHPFLLYGEKAVEPLGESRPDIEIYRLLARGLGIGEYFDHTDDELLEMSLSKPWAERLGVTLDRLKAEGAIKVWYQDTATPNVGGGYGGVFPTATGRPEFSNEHPKPRARSTSAVKFDAEGERLPRFAPPGGLARQRGVEEVHAGVLPGAHPLARAHPVRRRGMAPPSGRRTDQGRTARPGHGGGSLSTAVRRSGSPALRDHRSTGARSGGTPRHARRRHPWSSVTPRSGGSTPRPRRAGLAAPPGAPAKDPRPRPAMAPDHSRLRP
jgi:Molybdopterin oxidoreductase